jgi:purine-binding chemotaxis protein CheW
MTRALEHDSILSPPGPRADFYLVFSLSGVSYALPLAFVDRVYRAVEITPVKTDSPHVPGIVVIHGSAVPVLDVRKRLTLPPKEAAVDHHLLVLTSGGRRICCIVDRVREIRFIEADSISGAGPSGPPSNLVAGIANTADGAVLIQDGARIFSEVFQDPENQPILQPEDAG